MPEFGEVIYNVESIIVAALQSDNTYGTPAIIEYGQELIWEFEADNDELSGYGMTVELLAIIRKAMTTLKKGSLSSDARTILTGMSQSTSGTTPNQIATHDVVMGGSGLPYFGVVFQGASVFGNVIGGAPKCKLETYPKLGIAENKFSIHEAKLNAIAPSTTIRKAFRLKRYETAGSIPTDASGFDTFFSGMFDS